MRLSLLAVVVLAASALAGCAAETPEREDPFEDVEVEVSSTTGGIRGVVVDERIVPVEGATVALAGTDVSALSASTDAEGRFTFDSLRPGSYFLRVSSPLHRETQSSAEVVAGVADPPIVRIQVERLFKQDPYSVQVVREGFFECSQSGASVWYSSSNCADGVFGPASDEVPELSNVTRQDRDFHADVGPGWQVLVFEMTWEPTAQGTSPNMGMVVSTYKPERDTSHWFANFEGANPLRGEIRVGEKHESAADTDPEEIPPEGIERMSYFMSVRGDGATPGIAYNQRFQTFLTMFHYGVPPEGWSVVAGDELPF